MKNILAFLVGMGLVMYAKNKRLPRGIRNNNPGNIREKRSSHWDGQSGTDGEFAIFTAPVFGIRALARVLMTYEKKHGINTVDGVIRRWAPDSENDTDSYIKHTAKALNVGRGQYINVTERLGELIRVIIKHENGEQPYSDDLIKQGIDMAGGY